MPTRKLKGSWWVDFRHRGIRYRKRSPLNTRGGAREYELTLRGRLSRGEALDDTRHEDYEALRFEEFAERWFATHVVANNKPSERYTKRILLAAHLLPWFGGFELASIGSELVEQYKAAKLRDGLSAKTVNNHLAVLRKCLRSAVEWEVLATNPMIRPLKSAPPRFDYLKPEEVRSLVGDRAELSWNSMIVVAASTGLRVGELLALDWADVDLSGRRITVRRSCWQTEITSTKTYYTRHVPLTQAAMRAFADLHPTRGLVFDHAFGDRLHPYHAARDALHRACARTGLRRIGWHVLRHTFASTLASSGVPLHVIQALLGHTSVATTQRYAHLAPSVLTDAIAILEGVESDGHTDPSGQPAVNRQAEPVGRSDVERSISA